MAQKPRGRPKAFHDKTDQNTVQALDRALFLLEHMALGSGRTLSDLAEETGQAVATTFRALHCQAASPVKTLDRLDVMQMGEEIHIHAAFVFIELLTHVFHECLWGFFISL